MAGWGASTPPPPARGQAGGSAQAQRESGPLFFSLNSLGLVSGAPARSGRPWGRLPLACSPGRPRARTGRPLTSGAGWSAGGGPPYTLALARGGGAAVGKKTPSPSRPRPPPPPFLSLSLSPLTGALVAARATTAPRRATGRAAVGRAARARCMVGERGGWAGERTARETERTRMEREMRERVVSSFFFSPLPPSPPSSAPASRLITVRVVLLPHVLHLAGDRLLQHLQD